VSSRFLRRSSAAYLVVIAASGGAPAQSPAPLGAELRVNSYTAGGQRAPVVAMSPDGGFVVVWEDLDVLPPGNGRDGSVSGVFGRRFDPSGTALASEFQVSTYTRGTQQQPALDMDGRGGFVVVWSSAVQDGSDSGIFARRFDAAGTALGVELQVNTYTANAQWDPAVGVDRDGGFVVAWSSSRQDGDGEGVFARRFTASGDALGAEFSVNVHTSGEQKTPAIGVDDDGDFVVAWASERDGYDYGVFARRFDSAGTARGGELQVNAYTRDNEHQPAVAIDRAGNFVVAFTRVGGDESDALARVFVRLFDAAGEPRSGELAVPPVVPSQDQPFPPALAMDPSGGFVVAWDEGSNEVFARLFDAAGSPVGPAFHVNSYTPFSQYLATVDLDASRFFVVTWTTQRSPTDLDVAAQRFRQGPGK
jgi:hypothetical protein